MKWDSMESLQMRAGLLEVCGRPRDPGLAPKEVATGFGAQQTPLGLFQVSRHKRRVHMVFAHLRAGGMEFVAEVLNPSQRPLLRLRTCPLKEIFAVMPASVPGAGADPDFALNAVAV